MLGISRREGLRKLTEEMYSNAALADVVSQLVKADGDVLRSLTEIIHAANEISNDGHTGLLVTNAISVALQDPEAVTRTFAIRRAGGLRARFLSWLLSG